MVGWDPCFSGAGIFTTFSYFHHIFQTTSSPGVLQAATGPLTTCYIMTPLALMQYATDLTQRFLCTCELITKTLRFCSYTEKPTTPYKQFQRSRMPHPTKGAALKLFFKGPTIRTTYSTLPTCVSTSIGVGTSRPKTLSVNQPGVPIFVVN